MAKKNNKILFIAALHGNEGFGVDVMKKIEASLPSQDNNYEWVVGNPEAYKQDIRFTKEDLNRIAPGDAESEIYELKRAAELVKLSKDFSYVIDIHGTNANSGIFILVTNPTIENLLLAASLPIKNVVIWASKNSLKQGPITQFLHCPAVEIECGPKDSKDIQLELEKVINNVLTTHLELPNLLDSAKKKNYYRVYGKIENADTTQLKEFEKVKVDDEEFYPLLINSYVTGSTRKMKKVDLFNMFCY